MTQWWAPEYNGDDAGVPAPVYEPRPRRCEHRQQTVTFPSGVAVWCHTSWCERHRVPDLGFYTDPAMLKGVTWVSTYLPWEDRGLPLAEAPDTLIAGLYDMAVRGYEVEIGCYAGHGRTACVLAAMVKIDAPDVPALQWVAENYCRQAVESMTVEQVAWVGDLL